MEVMFGKNKLEPRTFDSHSSVAKQRILPLLSNGRLLSTWGFYGVNGVRVILSNVNNIFTICQVNL